MLDKKQIWVIFFSSSKWVVKQQRQLTISTAHLAQELLMNRQCTGGSRNFAKDTGALKMRGSRAGHQRLTMINWEDQWSWSNYKYTRSCKESNLNHSTVIQHLSQTRKLKRLDKWVLHELTEKKNHHFEMLSSVQSLSHVWLFANPWTAAHQASLSIINS